MHTPTWGQHLDTFTVNRLTQMVGPDPHRPGVARARLLVEQIPVWALIGHIGAIAGSTEPAAITNEVVAQSAIDYDIRREAVLAAVLYYEKHREAIDALLESNAAAIA